MIKPRVKIGHWKLRESEATGRKINGFLGGCQYLADLAQTDIVSHSLIWLFTDVAVVVFWLVTDVAVAVCWLVTNEAVAVFRLVTDVVIAVFWLVTDVSVAVFWLATDVAVAAPHCPLTVGRNLKENL